MAITKILARKSPLADGVSYILNEEKTDRFLTVHLNCDPGREVQEMLDTKRAAGPNGKMDGVQYYHIVQSFKPGEITPELALEIATKFAEEHLPGFEAVIAVHVDKEHIHAHTIIGDASDLGHFFWLMEHMGWEISYGNRLGFRLRGQPRPSGTGLGRPGGNMPGQEHFMVPGRKNPLFTENGIRAAILGNLSAIETGQRLPTAYRVPYRLYKKHPKYTGFLALYVHYFTQQSRGFDEDE